MGEVTIKAVDGVDFHIEKGEFAIIVGPSGAGKTTVLNMLGGMDACTSGEILVDGTQVSSFNARQLRICLPVLQPGAEPHRPGECGAGRPDLQRAPGRQGRAGARGAGAPFEQLPRPALRRRAAAGGHRPCPGQKPQAATGALDYVTGKAILKLLQDTCRLQGMTVVVITHNTALTPMADRVIHIKNGRVEEMTCNPHPTPVEAIEW